MDNFWTISWVAITNEAEVTQRNGQRRDPSASFQSTQNQYRRFEVTKKGEVGKSGGNQADKNAEKERKKGEKAHTLLLKSSFLRD